jgi:IPT/TIG domain/PASTA domain
MNRSARVRAARVLAILGLALAASGWAAGSSEAAVTIGSLLVGEFSTGVVAGETNTLANTSLSEFGAHVVSPITGTIVRWRTKGEFDGPIHLRVLRPATGGEYVGVGTSGPEPSTGGSQTYSTSLPIQAGDLIGLDMPAPAGGGYSVAAIQEVAGSAFSGWEPFLGEGVSAAPKYLASNYEVGFNADVQPPPELILVSPNSGPASGGTLVTIAGAEFESVQAVKFGSQPAASIKVNSERSITAVSPPSSHAGTVDVTIVTAGGTSQVTAGDQFTYTAPSTSTGLPQAPKTCLVPNLKGKTLKAAKKRARKVNCRIGSLKLREGVTKKTGKVVKQKPKDGKVKAAGSKIAVTLG